METIVEHAINEHLINEHAINKQIIDERNHELKLLSEDIESLHEITRTLSGMIAEQKEGIDVASEQIETSEILVNEASQSIEQAAKLSSIGNLKSFLLKGTLVSTGIAGIGVGTLFLNPIAGIIIGTMGIGGIAVCTINYFKTRPF